MVSNPRVSSMTQDPASGYALQTAAASQAYLDLRNAERFLKVRAAGEQRGYD